MGGTDRALPYSECGAETGDTAPCSGGSEGGECCRRARAEVQFSELGGKGIILIVLPAFPPEW